MDNHDRERGREYKRKVGGEDKSAMEEAKSWTSEVE